MSHHLLSPYGGPVTPHYSPRGQHCGYMEQLRQSVEQLRHQTARTSPSGCTNSDFSTRLSGRPTDTLYQSASATPECLVVYEPHVIVRTNEHFHNSQRYRTYSDSSSSSESSSSSPEIRPDDVSDLLEDSGVDIGYPKLQTPHNVYVQNHDCHLKSNQQKLQHPPYQQHCHLKQDDHNGYKHHKDSKFQNPQNQLNRPNQRESTYAMANSSDPKHMCHFQQQKHLANESCEGNHYLQSHHMPKDGNKVDKSTHRNISQFGGVCFCAVEVRKPNKNMESQKCNYSQTKSQGCLRKSMNDLDYCHKHKGSVECLNETHPHNKNHTMNAEVGDPLLKNSGTKTTKSTRTGSSGSKISLTSALIGNGSKLNPNPIVSVQKDNVYIDMTKSSGSLASGNVGFSKGDASDERITNKDFDSRLNYDMPDTTPTSYYNDDAYCSRSYLNQGCQTKKSVFKKESPGSRVDKNNCVLVQADVHQNLSIVREGNGNNDSTVEYVQASANCDGKDGNKVQYNGLNFSQGNGGKGNDTIQNHDQLKRSPSVTSLISMTDTMSVTSLEVANIMAVSSKDEKKSAVKLEKERLQLQHQRLESYQNNDHEDAFKKYAWTEKSRRQYSDDSLKKHKIYQSVLETLPIGKNKLDGDSNLHHFVTQSLQSFFTAGGQPCHRKQDNNQAEPSRQQNAQNFHQNHQGHDDDMLQRTPTNEGFMNASSPKQVDQPVPLPSLFQLTVSFRLFHVVYGDWTDLRNLRLYAQDLILEDNSRSSSASSRSSGSSGSRSVMSMLSGDSGAFRMVNKGSPAGRYTFLVISNLGNPRMELDTGGLHVGDHIIEVNDVCMLNKPQEAFYTILSKARQVHLVIGRRRPGFSANQMASCDSSML